MQDSVKLTFFDPEMRETYSAVLTKESEGVQVRVYDQSGAQPPGLMEERPLVFNLRQVASGDEHVLTVYLRASYEIMAPSGFRGTNLSAGELWTYFDSHQCEREYDLTVTPLTFSREQVIDVYRIQSEPAMPTEGMLNSFDWGFALRGVTDNGEEKSGEHRTVSLFSMRYPEGEYDSDNESKYSVD